MADTSGRPIIVIKRKGGHGGHHGGAWKVAYADFVTALMSLFIVLWLMGSSEKVKKAVAGYFNDPKGTGKLLGTTMNGTGPETEISDAKQQALQDLKEKLEKEIRDKKELEKLMKQIEMTITAEGLRIELIEDKNGTFFQSGSAQLSVTGQELLKLLATELKTLPNQMLIEGHTDAAQYSTDTSYSNWELSADRANSARRLMQQNGVRADQVTQIRGYADQLLRVKNNPYDPSNRRISLLVKNVDAAATAQFKNVRVVGGPPPAPAAAPNDKKGKEGDKKGAPPDKKAEAVPPPAAKPPAPAPPASKPAGSAAKNPATKPAPGKPGLMARLMAMMPGKKQ
jgi:chemotaxis protein MotB